MRNEADVQSRKQLLLVPQDTLFLSRLLDPSFNPHLTCLAERTSETSRIHADHNQLTIRLFEDIPFLRRFQQTQREETAKEEAAKKAAAEKPLIEDGADATVSSDGQGEGIFGGIGEAAAREATRAKTAKVFKEVCQFH